MTPTIDIRRVGTSDLTEIAATVAAGFFDDPVTRWLVPDADQRRRLVQPMFELYVGAVSAARRVLPHR